MKSPKISIVTISFNQKEHLRMCLDSVMRNKDDQVEYIVVDPGSTDGSRELIESYGNRIDHVVFEPDDGPADGLNKGFQRATGDVGYFINSDDFLLPGAIASLRRIWCESPEIDILLGGAWMVNGAGEPLRELRATPVTLSGLIYGNVSIVQQGMFFRLAVFRKIGGFNRVNRTCWDYELLCAALYAGVNVYSTQERFGAFRIYGESLSGGVNGNAHTRRYQADLERIRLELTGHETQKASDGSYFFSMIYRHARHPSLSVRLLCDRLLPSAMKRRWLRDMGLSEGRSK